MNNAIRELTELEDKLQKERQDVINQICEINMALKVIDDMIYKNEQEIIRRNNMFRKLPIINIF